MRKRPVVLLACMFLIGILWKRTGLGLVGWNRPVAFPLCDTMEGAGNPVYCFGNRDAGDAYAWSFVLRKADRVS